MFLERTWPKPTIFPTISSPSPALQYRYFIYSRFADIQSWLLSVADTRPLRRQEEHHTRVAPSGKSIIRRQHDPKYTSYIPIMDILANSSRTTFCPWISGPDRRSLSSHLLRSSGRCRQQQSSRSDILPRSRYLRHTQCTSGIAMDVLESLPSQRHRPQSVRSSPPGLPA